MSFDQHQLATDSVLRTIFSFRFSGAEAMVLLESIITGVIYRYYSQNISVGIESLDLATERVVTRLRELEKKAPR